MHEVKDLVRSLADLHGRTRESLIPILQGIVKDQQYISSDNMIEVAKELDMSAAQVYGTATFYSFLDTQPRGKYIIRVCRTISCSMKGKSEVIDEIKKVLKIEMGETTRNNKFSLLETNCLGWCHKGPVMLINDEVYTELTLEKVRIILDDYRERM